MKIQRWLVLPDLQIPYHDKKSLKAVEAYMSAYEWDGWIQLGDFLDFNALSSYAKGKPGTVKLLDSVARTFDAGRAILTRHARILRSRNVSARMVLLQGNHDYRAVSYAEEHPGMKEHLDVPKHLNLAELDIEWIKSWEDGKLFKLGNAYFTHGLIVSKHHAAAMAHRYGVPIFYGHTHSVQEFTEVLYGANKTIAGKSLGCLCDYRQAYMKGAPSAWQQAISTFFVFPDGYFTEYTSRIFKHRFVGPDGRVYDGNGA